MSNTVQLFNYSCIFPVIIDKIGQGSQVTSIKSDDIDVAHQATKHLLSLSHRHIAFMAGSVIDLAGPARLLVCQQALAQAGIALDPGLVHQSGWNLDEVRVLSAECRDFNPDVGSVSTDSSNPAVVLKSTVPVPKELY